MSQIRRVLIFACIALSATALAAQTPGTTTTQKDETYTTPVTAETDKDVSNPRAMRLSLDDAIRTAVAQNIGVQIQRYDYREAGQTLREAAAPSRTSTSSSSCRPAARTRSGSTTPAR